MSIYNPCACNDEARQGGDLRKGSGSGSACRNCFTLRRIRIMSTIEQNLQAVRRNIEAAAHEAGRTPESVQLLAVSKT